MLLIEATLVLAEPNLMEVTNNIFWLILTRGPNNWF
jgi:hypothetical protein